MKLRITVMSGLMALFLIRIITTGTVGHAEPQAIDPAIYSDSKLSTSNALNIYYEKDGTKKSVSVEIPMSAKSIISKMLKKNYFIVFRTMKTPSKLTPNLILEHLHWMVDLEKRGIIFLSGPLFDSSGNQSVGITVFRAEDFSSAKKIALSDPIVNSGVAEVELKRWQLNEGRLSINVDLSDQTYTLN